VNETYVCLKDIIDMLIFFVIQLIILNKCFVCFELRKRIRRWDCTNLAFGTLLDFQSVKQIQVSFAQIYFHSVTAEFCCKNKVFFFKVYFSIFHLYISTSPFVTKILQTLQRPCSEIDPSWKNLSVRSASVQFSGCSFADHIFV